jgi:hypothetical protein
VTDLTTDEYFEEEARRVADVPPLTIPDAQGLPADVPDGRVEDGEAHPDVQEQPIAEPKED